MAPKLSAHWAERKWLTVRSREPNALLTTGAVTGTLTAAKGKTTYICGFEVDATGAGTFPVTVPAG